MTAPDPTRARDGSTGGTVRSSRAPNEGMVVGDERDRLANRFGARLVAERYRAGLTQAALAEQSGYSCAHVARLEHGERRPTDSTTWRLAKALIEVHRGSHAAMVELDVQLMMAAGESLRVLYRTRPRLRWLRRAQQVLDYERAKQRERERLAALTERERLEEMTAVWFDLGRHAPQ
jgi:transcriptional regulator with XRE-family HTH domain